MKAERQITYEKVLTERNLTVQDLSNLKAGFLSPEIIEQSGIFRVDSATGAEKVGQSKKLSKEDFAGLIIPYFFPEDNSPREFRLRRDNAPKEQKLSGQIKEVGKYLSPVGRNNLLYFPPKTLKHWLNDSSIDVVITEGEKKTLALDRAAWHGLSDAAETPRFLALGLQGVNNFRGKVGKETTSSGEKVSVKGLIPDFGLIEWKERKVFILFDANVATNHDVKIARLAFANILIELGAEVYLTDLPEMPNCNGIDDVLGKFEREKGEKEAVNYLFDLLARSKPKISRKSQFQLKADGVYYLESDKDGNEKLTKICAPLEIAARTCGSLGNNHGRLLKWKDIDGRNHSYTMPLELAHADSNEHIKHLVSWGLEVSPTKFAREKLSRYIAESKPLLKIICTDKTGWHGKSFVLPDSTIGKAQNGAEILFQSLNLPEHRFAFSGSLNDWKRHVARLCIGNSRLVFAVSTAFAACLLTPLVENGGGFHFRGASSLGKSTALLVGGSVWGGDDRRGFSDTWRTTANGLESIAELHNDSLLCLDELKECDPKAASEVAYMLANGQGKARMSKNIGARRTLTWNLLFLSTGELSLSDLIEQSGGRIYGGQEVRMSDIPADAEKGFGLFENLHEFSTAELLAKSLQENARNFYGTAILKFIENISTDFENLRSHWIGYRREFMNEVLPIEATGEAQRVASRFALIAFAGTLAASLCGWSEIEAETACRAIFKNWLDSRGNASTDIENAVRQVRAFLETHGSSRFQDIGSASSFVANRVGFRRVDISTNEIEFLIFPEAFRNEICKGFDYRNVIKELKQRAFLVCDAGKNQKTERLPDLGAKKVYVINSNIFESETE